MAEATQAQIRAAELLESLWNDAEVGEKVRKAAKAKFADTKIVDDVVAPFVEPLKAENEALRKRFEKLEEERAEERKLWNEHNAKLSIEQAMEKARKDYNLTDEGLDRAVERVKQMGSVSDIGAAMDTAAAWVAQKTPPTPVAGPTWAPQDMNYFGTKNHDDALAELHRDPVRYQDAQLAEFFKNPDKFVQETLGG